MKKIIIMLLAISLLQQTDLSAQTPSITCPSNQTVPTTANSCNAVVKNIDPIISPAGASYRYLIVGTGESAIGSVSGKTFPVGVSTIVYTLIDYPTVTCSFTITVQDKTAPVITCPANLTVKCAQDIPLPTDLTALDACANGIIVAQFVSDVRSNTICENKFTITRTYRATDGAGNTSTCAQIITVNDD